MLIIVGLVVAVVVIFFLIYHTTANNVLHTVIETSSGTTIYSGNTAVLVTSDGGSNVLLGTNAGLILYNTDTRETITINKSIATGLAYDGERFMILEGDGTLSDITLDGTKTEISPGYSRLYDTLDGYLVTVGGITSITGASGTSIPAGGQYGTIQLNIT